MPGACLEVGKEEVKPHLELSSKFVGFIGLAIKMSSNCFERLFRAVAYLEHSWCDKSLDLGGLGCRLLNFLALLNWQRPLDDVLPDVVLLAQVEQLPQVRGTLGAQTTGDGVGGQPRDLGLAGLEKRVRMSKGWS